MDPVAVAEACVARRGASELVLYENGARFTLAIGARKRVIVDHGVLERHDGQAKVTSPSADPFADVPRALSELGASDVAAYGYVSFDAAYGHLPYRKHAPYPCVHLIVPEATVSFADGEVEVAASEGAEELLATALDAAPFELRAPSSLTVDDSDEQARFTPRIEAALEAIRAGTFEKVIVSRDVRFEGELDVLATHANARRSGAARRFAFRLGRVAGVGSSPSPVLVSDGRTVSTLPLAGTRHRGETPEADQQLTRELFADAKEVREHAMSVRRVLAELRPVCEQGSVVVADFMTTVKYRFTQHIASRIEGTLAAGETSWDALRHVFPAVTVTGVEKEPAVAFIDSIEPTARGVYGGAVGVFGPAGHIDTGIALRSVFGYGGEIVLNAGAGIVAESELDFEFRESSHKLRTMLVNVVTGSRRS